MNNNSVALETLKREIKSLIADLSTNIETVGKELANPARVDEALINKKLAMITSQTHQFVRFLPRTAEAKAKFVDENGEPSPRESHEWAELNSQVYGARTWMAQWPKVEAMIRDQIPTRRRKLYPQTKRGDISHSQSAVFDGIFDRIQKTLNTQAQDAAAKEQGCFADIALPQSVFLQHAHAAYRVLLSRSLRHPSRFLDVGCGGGMKVLSAAAYFDRCDGLEFDPGYVDAARQLFEITKQNRCDVIHANGLTYQHYDNYDVVYFYRPMRHVEQLRQLEEQIIAGLRPGTLIIAPYKMFDYRYKELGCGRIDGQLYISKTSQSDADALRRVAELTGTSPRNDSPRPPSIWDPILNASLARGYGLIDLNGG